MEDYAPKKEVGAHRMKWKE